MSTPKLVGRRPCNTTPQLSVGNFNRKSHSEKHKRQRYRPKFQKNVKKSAENLVDDSIYVRPLPTFLAPDHWSPRYGSSFFTIKMKEYKTIEHKSSCDFDTLKCGNTAYPAIYYSVCVTRGDNSERIMWRRYSQFLWLFNCMNKLPFLESPLKALPPKRVDVPIIGKFCWGDGDGCFPFFQFQGKERRNAEKGRVDNDGSCFDNSLKIQSANKNGLKMRFEGLGEFLLDLLSRPNMSKHPAMVEFLALDNFHDVSTPVIW
uniref:PX domain-containing protein n=1 Tax=Corethron hystrix TaxID=216773 RepID=A0A7S1FWZ9_9STRA|mmetsp:Transcript_37189/g.86714  ORF Transcript_37189/g.86714 Transcript_37189/m.86714 type:complete len:260 (+) Transcript_37189:55-834(+)